MLSWVNKLLSLAAMVWSIYMFCRSELHMFHQVPPPIVIVQGKEFKYSQIDNAIYVAKDWKGTCEQQQLLVLQMEDHFNAYRNGNQKISEKDLDLVSNEWRCLDVRSN